VAFFTHDELQLSCPTDHGRQTSLSGFDFESAMDAALWQMSEKLCDELTEAAVAYAAYGESGYLFPICI